MGALQANAAAAVAVALTGLSLLLLVIGLASYQRVRNAKLLWVSAAFAGFAAKGVYFTVDAYRRRGELAADLDAMPALAAADLAIVAALYLAVLKR